MTNPASVEFWKVWKRRKKGKTLIANLFCLFVPKEVKSYSNHFSYNNKTRQFVKISFVSQ
jgi:hypothetical protein